MDGLSIAASVIAIGTAGIQISIKLSAFASQVKTAQNVISAIANDVSLTSGVLQELGALIKKKKPDQDVGIFSDGALRITQSSARTCQELFKDIESRLRKASSQTRDKTSEEEIPIILSKGDQVRWPFRQPKIERLRTELEKSKITLMLILQVTTLGYTEALVKANKPLSIVDDERPQLIRAIEGLEKNLRQQKRVQAEHVSPHSSVRPQDDEFDLPTNPNSGALPKGPSASEQDHSPKPSERSILTPTHEPAPGPPSIRPATQRAFSPGEVSALVSSAQQISSQDEHKHGVVEATQSGEEILTREDVPTEHTVHVQGLSPAKASNHSHIHGAALTQNVNGDRESAEETAKTGIKPAGQGGALDQANQTKLVSSGVSVKPSSKESDEFLATNQAANAGCFTRIFSRWCRSKQALYMESLRDLAFLREGELEIWRIQTIERPTYLGYERYAQAYLIPIEHGEVLEHLLKARRQKRMTVWQRHDALSHLEREALNRNVLFPHLSPRPSWHYGDPVLLAIVVEDRGINEDLDQPKDRRRVKVILRRQPRKTMPQAQGLLLPPPPGPFVPPPPGPTLTSSSRRSAMPVPGGAMLVPDGDSFGPGVGIPQLHQSGTQQRSSIEEPQDMIYTIPKSDKYMRKKAWHSDDSSSSNSSSLDHRSTEESTKDLVDKLLAEYTTLYD